MTFTNSSSTDTGKFKIHQDFFVCLFNFIIMSSDSMKVPNQLVGAPLATDVTLICNVEASPKAINYWQRENGKKHTK